MRKYYIDNIRIFSILLLFPFHTAMCFNTFGDPFYVFSQPVTAFSEFINIVYPWWMTLLFVLAGISSVYALKKRTPKEYINERISKLFIPFLFGMVLIVPAQTYISDIFHNGYKGGFFEHYIVFFSKFTDLTGYDGGFTPAHLWFMLYLVIISLVILPLMIWYNKREKKLDTSKINMLNILPMFLLLLIMAPILDIGGKSLGEFSACFLLGFFILSDDKVSDMLEKHRFSLGIAWILLMSGRSIWSLYYNDSGLLLDIYQRIFTWVAILAIIGLGKRYLNFNSKFTEYFSKAAFPLYFLHQTILVIVAFFVLKVTNIVVLQFMLICILSFTITIGIYELFKRIPVTRFMFGIKK